MGLKRKIEYWIEFSQFSLRPLILEEMRVVAGYIATSFRGQAVG
jgi:hypothetical protein